MRGKLVYEDGWFVEYEAVTTKGKKTKKELPVMTPTVLDIMHEGMPVSFDIEEVISLDKIKRYAKLKS